MNSVQHDIDCKEKNKRPLPSVVRTQGDGMENATTGKFENLSLRKDNTTLGSKLLYHPSDLNQFTFTPPVITGKIVNLVPKSMIHSKKYTVLGNMKGKEPKFVPYEPYKAAVKPIVPLEKKSKGPERKHSKKHANLSVLSVQVSESSCSKLDDARSPSSKIKGNEKNVTEDWVAERKLLKETIKTLKEDNEQLESQLKYQAQVNGELKNLLVASVGEDLETRVHVLTEDKLQLARALLNSAQSLSTHQEQTEWLAGQCEVWRSKFLASSLMVEELARWKAALCQKTTDLQELMKRLLEERSEVREFVLSTYRNLSIVRDNLDCSSLDCKDKLPSSNILDVSIANEQLASVLFAYLVGESEKMKIREPNLTGLDMNTVAEKMAESLLSKPNSLLLSGHPDAACNAVVGAAVALGGQLLLGSSSLPVSCSHCSGEIKQV